jgi:digeranylgeranylglycerophospholipid reductase
MKDRQYDTDVTVVGGGPAGLMASLRLSSLGLSNVVLERSEVIGEPVHTSGGSWIKDLKDLGIPEKFYNPIKSAIFMSNNSRAEFKLEKATACVILIRDLLKYLAVRSVEKGSNVIIGAPVFSMRNEGKMILTKYHRLGEEITLKSKYGIDASGFSRVSLRTEENHPLPGYIGYGAQYEAWVENLDRNSIYLMVGSNYSKDGYTWVFPTDDHVARIGTGFIGIETSRNPQKLLDNLVHDNAFFKKEFGKIIPIERHTGIVPANGIAGTSVLGRILLTGDSSGLATPHIGEGIRFAMKYGKLAAETISKAIASGSNSEIEGILIEYDKIVQKELGQDFKIAYKIQRTLADLSDIEWDKAVSSLQSLSNDEFIAFLRGDFSKKYILSLLLKHPSLIRGLVM